MLLPSVETSTLLTFVESHPLFRFRTLLTAYSLPLLYAIASLLNHFYTDKERLINTSKDWVSLVSACEDWLGLSYGRISRSRRAERIQHCVPSTSEQIENE